MGELSRGRKMAERRDGREEGWESSREEGRWGRGGMGELSRGREMADWRDGKVRKTVGRERKGERKEDSLKREEGRYKW